MTNDTAERGLERLTDDFSDASPGGPVDEAVR